MNPLQQLYNQLLQGGYPPEQIPDIIRKLGAAQQAGMFQNLNIGTAEQDRADRQAEQARLAQEFRVQTGLGALGLMQTDEQQRAAREGDPFRFVEFLRGVSELPQGAAGNPVSSLVGQGFTIKPQLPTDPNYQSLLDDIAAFGRPQAAAAGGRVRVPEPAALIGQSGTPYLTVNENGPEKISVTPRPGQRRTVTPLRQQAILDRVYRNRADPPGGVITPAPPPPPVPADLPRIPGDINGDGYVNPGDQAIAARRRLLLDAIATSFGARSGDPRFNPSADLNRDGILNSLDSFAAARWRPAPRLNTPRGPVYAMAAGGSFGGFASADERQAAINRLAATPGAAEAFAAYDRARAAGGRTGPVQDPTFGGSTDSEGARPAGDALYNIGPDGSVQIEANPSYGGTVQPGQSYKNVIGPDGVGRYVPITDAEATQLAIRAHNDRVNFWQTGGRHAWSSLAENITNAGGRPAPTFGPNANLQGPGRVHDYTPAYPGGVNAPRLYGSGPFVSRPGPHDYDVYGNDRSGTNGPRVRAYTAEDIDYLRTHPAERVPGIPVFDPVSDTFRPAGFAGGGYAVPGFPMDNGRPVVAASGSGSAPGAGPGGAASGPVTPAQAAAMAMGKALANNPFAPTELVRDLQAGKAANPAYLNQRLRANLDPNLWQGLLSTNQGFGFRPDSVLASAQQYDIPTFNTYYKRF